MDTPERFQVRSSETVYADSWLSVDRLQIVRGGQDVGTYSVVRRSDSVSMVLHDQLGCLLLLQQYRYPTHSLSWELPMGGIDAGETVMDAAKRELREETGLEVGLEVIGMFHPMPGLSDQRVWVLKGNITDEVVSPTRATDPDEPILERRLFTPRKVLAMTCAGQITDGFTLSSLSLASAKEQHP